MAAVQKKVPTNIKQKLQICLFLSECKMEERVIEVFVKNISVVYSLEGGCGNEGLEGL